MQGEVPRLRTMVAGTELPSSMRWNLVPVTSELNLVDVSGDRRVLHWRHMYRIRELSVLSNEARMPPKSPSPC